MTTLLVTAAALALDWTLGEPRRFHPLVAFGRLAALCERWGYGGTDVAPHARRVRGLCATVSLVVPLTAAAAALAAPPSAGLVFSVAVLYFALGHRSLHDHAWPVAAALRRGDEPEARRRTSLMVSRDSAALDVTCAATESVLENGNDAVFGALFWFALGGAPGALLYRLANTLDAMWGYRNGRYFDFGWAAARLDDALNYVPARLTALTYAVLGNSGQALRCWRTQARGWASPNAGPVMAAGAGALGVIIGGPARYAGEWQARPVLGAGQPPAVDDIERALGLVRGGVWLWLAVFGLAGALHA
ncbi:MAG: adenosylcobinamide-phosphate synthase CbiB [Pseudomonadota bacterium]|nr:adenosylcobinamide-phosphate synthase CbiB [Pseudomonadota bacterium]